MELHKYINEAWATYYSVNKDPRAKYRFGQALWNQIPTGVSHHIYMTDKDFFNWSDERVAEILEIAYTEFVYN